MNQQFQLHIYDLENTTIQVRRNFSNISCADFGKTILDDISAKTVSRSEQKMGACLIAAARLFHEQMKHDMREMSGDGFSIAVHAYRQDATNGKRKVSAVEIETMYKCGISEAQASTLACDDFRRHKFISDLLPVGDESGPGCVGITLRGFECQSCPTWRDIRDHAHLNGQKFGFISSLIFFLWSCTICYIYFCIIAS